MEQFVRGSEWSKRASTGPQKDNTRSHISFITAFRKKTKYLRNIGKKTIELILCLIINYVDLVPHLKVLPSGPNMEEQILILVQRGPSDFSKDSISRRTWFISCSKCPSTPHHQGQISLAITRLAFRFSLVFLEKDNGRNWGMYFTEVISQPALQKVIKAPTEKKGKQGWVEESHCHQGN